MLQMDNINEEISRSLSLLGSNLRTARVRRQETQDQFAKRIGTTRQRVAEMENGSPSVAMSYYARALWAIGMTEDLGEIAHPDRDIQGKVAERENDPERVSSQRRDAERYNF
jgi:transcriptional regulator with XRE-family HTH domain